MVGSENEIFQSLKIITFFIVLEVIGPRKNDGVIKKASSKSLDGYKIIANGTERFLTQACEVRGLATLPTVNVFHSTCVMRDVCTK